jgi:hypothetical protein
MSVIDDLVAALASLRDSLIRLSNRLETPGLATRALRGRIRTNEAMKKIAIQMAAGTMPAVPASLVIRAFTAGGLVSVAEAEDSMAVKAALAEAEAVLDDCETLLGG